MSTSVTSVISGEDETEDRNDSLINDGDGSKSPPKRPPGKRAESAKPARNKVLNVATKSKMILVQ